MTFTETTTHSSDHPYDKYVTQEFYVTEFECDGTVHDYVKIGEKLKTAEGQVFSRIIRVYRPQLAALHKMLGDVLERESQQQTRCNI